MHLNRLGSKEATEKNHKMVDMYRLMQINEPPFGLLAGLLALLFAGYERTLSDGPANNRQIRSFICGLAHEKGRTNCYN
jgi:hypothetical protein